MISKRHVGAIVLVAALGVLGLASAGLAADPPGQGPCSHGNSGKECKPDPQPDHGAECDEHGPNEGGVNEDHCLGGTTGTTTTGTTTSSTTTSVVSTSSTTTEGTTVGSLPSASTQPADAVPAVVAGGVLGKTKSASTPKAPSAPKVAAKVKGNIRVLPFTP
jgi:hypothetical protein